MQSSLAVGNGTCFREIRVRVFGGKGMFSGIKDVFSGIRARDSERSGARLWSQLWIYERDITGALTIYSPFTPG